MSRVEFLNDKMNFLFNIIRGCNVQNVRYEIMSVQLVFWGRLTAGYTTKDSD